MAEVNLNPINTVDQNTINRNIRTPEIKPPVREAQEERKTQRAGEENAPQKPVEPYENIVAVSEDGDTVQASPESLQELREDAFGNVTERQRPEFDGEDEENENNAVNAQNEREDEEAYDPVKAAQEDAQRRAQIREDIRLKEERMEEALKAAEEAPVKVEAAEETKEELTTGQATSFAGYTDEQLRTLYLSGEISRADYDAEMQSREAADQERLEDIQSGNEEFGREMATVNTLLNETAQDEIEMEEAFSPEANQNIAAADRVAAMEQVRNLRELEDFSITT